MTSAWPAGLFIVSFTSAVTAAVCALALLKMRGGAQRREHGLATKLSALQEEMRALERRVTKASEPEIEKASATPQVEGTPAEHGNAIAPEIQAVLAAAAMAAGGAGARVSSVRRLDAHEGASAWSRQGRVLVQSSHNLGARK